MVRRPTDTEVDAYVFIKKQLSALGWDTRNPERAPNGQVWTQNECLSNAELRRHLGLNKPENIVKVNEGVLWVIEAKRSHSELDRALLEAEGYARQLNNSTVSKAIIISGVAGNDLDTFLIRSRLLVEDAYTPIRMNGIEVSGLLSPGECQQLVESRDASLDDPPIDEDLFIKRAEHINEILHLGAVNPHQRANVMAALLLGMLSETGPNVNERSPTVLIDDINARVRDVLHRQGKAEFYDLIRISPPSTRDNHVKFRKALVDTIQELNNLNIRSAMNSGVDWLGAFYEVFLKYANWAQDLGIVLTPRHVTRHVAAVMDVQVNDIVYDPTCGTGGFLVAAFDSVKQRARPDQLARFKQNSLFGIEQDSGIAALAVVNMIFRGDGKNNIKEGNCFSQYLTACTNGGVPSARYLSPEGDTIPVTAPPITKVMMNPPFALKRSNEKEYKFIEQALRQMDHGGILFSVLPYSSMVRPSSGYKTWRQEFLLPHHTLLAVVTLPTQVFYPVGVTTVGVFIRKGTPHPRNQHVLWVRAKSDGLAISKGKRLPSSSETNDLANAQDLLRAFIHNPDHHAPNVHQYTKSAPINWDDPVLELVPEAYLDQASPSHDQINQGLEEGVRNLLAYLIKINRAELRPELLRAANTAVGPTERWAVVNVTDLFDLHRGDFHAIEDLDDGCWPTVSRIGSDNGFVGFHDKPTCAREWSPRTITVSSVTGDAFIQPVPFIATDNVVLCTPRREIEPARSAALFFLQLMINQVKWRYSYGRQCYKTKFASTNIPVPVDGAGEIDWDYMVAAVENTRYWPLVEAVLGR